MPGPNMTRCWASALLSLPLLALSACGALQHKSDPQSTVASAAPPAATTVVAMIAINDVYRIEGTDNGSRGGLARVAWLRQRLEAETGHAVPILHGGDLLSPSLYSLRKVGNFDGEEMVDVMNHLDGDAEKFDSHLFVTVGNHEFDNTRCRQAQGLKPFADRVVQSRFLWLSGNLDYTRCEGAEALANAPMRRSALFTVGGMRFGVFGVTVDSEGDTPMDRRKGPPIDPAYRTHAHELTTDLRARGAEFVIGLTHLDWASDVDLLAHLGSAGPDLIMGGHDHVRMAHFVPPAPRPGERYRAVYKASAEATDVAVYRFWRKPDGTPAYLHSSVDLDFRVPAAPEIERLVADWEQRLAERACPPGQAQCLDAPLGRTAYPWELDEESNRSRETRVGNWFADIVRGAAQDDGSFCAGHSGVVALLNSGSFRLNYEISADRPVLRKHVLATMPFGAPLAQLCVDATTLHEILALGLATPGHGRYPHFSGMQVLYSREAKATALAQIHTLRVGNSVFAKDSPARFLLVTGQFLADGGDGYPLAEVAGERRRDLGADLVELVAQRMATQDSTAAVSPANARKREQ